MRIAYLASYGSSFPSRDANSIHIMRMCEAIARLGHEVTLVASERGTPASGIFDHYGIPPSFTIHTVNVPKVKGKTLLYSLLAAAAVRRIRPGLVLGRSAIGLALSSYFGLRVVYDSHGPVWEMSRLEMMAYKSFRNSSNLVRMTVNSGALGEMYDNAGLLPHCGIVVAHNGSLSMPLDEKPGNWPGRKNALQAGYTGHLYPGRGMDTILYCAGRLPDVDFHIIGGNNEDIEYWRSVAPGTNIFFHGFVRHSDVHRFRNSCDILLAPYGSKNVSMAGGGGDQSRYMNPIKVIEYMSGRKAIICSDLPVLREILDENCALFADVDQPDSWISAIKKLHDSILREKLADNAYNRFLGNLTWEQRARKMVPSREYAGSGEPVQ